MCGIAGIASFEGKAERQTLLSMLKPIKYRGPDDTGQFLGKEAALGINRLKVIDLSTGDQPIKNEDGTVTVVFNGEIYNYRELRAQLSKKGHKLKTKSDTEVLVHLYEEYGPGFLDKLNGMFALALWDAKAKRLCLARDQSGIKPLYYWQKGATLVFGSELKAVLAYPGIRKQINPRAIDSYLALGYIPEPESVWLDIRKLPAGSSLIFSRKGVKTEGFRFLVNSSGQSLDRLLSDAVGLQSVADVPVGIFLSGGIDSSLLTYYLVKHRRNLRSFSIGFTEENMDESRFAREISRFLGTKHEEELFTPRDLIEQFPIISALLDEPLGDPSLFPTYKLCGLARKKVTVALSGDGGDELFGGYPTYRGQLFAGQIGRLPGGVKEIMQSVSLFSPVSFGSYKKSEVYDQFFSGLDLPPFLRQAYWTSGLAATKKELMSLSKSRWYKEKQQEAEGSFQQWDYSTYLRDDLLAKTDRASMYHSLEVRVPFLDPRIIEYAFSRENHADYLTTKKELRELVRQKGLPDSVLRPKKGFGIPLARWLSADLLIFSSEILSGKRLRKFIGKPRLDAARQEFAAGDTSQAKFLWRLMVLSGWLNRWT